MPPGHWALRGPSLFPLPQVLYHVWGTSGEDELWGSTEGQDFQDPHPARTHAKVQTQDGPLLPEVDEDPGVAHRGQERRWKEP